jgi:hypothetical protein
MGICCIKQPIEPLLTPDQINEQQCDIHSGKQTASPPNYSSTHICTCTKQSIVDSDDDQQYDSEHDQTRSTYCSPTRTPNKIKNKNQSEPSLTYSTSYSNKSSKSNNQPSKTKTSTNTSTNTRKQTIHTRSLTDEIREQLMKQQQLSGSLSPPISAPNSPMKNKRNSISTTSSPDRLVTVGSVPSMLRRRSSIQNIEQLKSQPYLQSTYYTLSSSIRDSLSKYTLYDLSINYCRIHYRDLKHNFTRQTYNLNTYFTYQNTMLTKSLLKSSKKNNDKCLKCFKLIQIFMWDYKSKKKLTREQIVEQIINMSTEIGDEIYLQILKQLNGRGGTSLDNISQIPDIQIQNCWQLFIYCTLIFAPSNIIFPYICSWLATFINGHLFYSNSIASMSAFAYWQLQKRKYGEKTMV